MEWRGFGESRLELAGDEKSVELIEMLVAGSAEPFSRTQYAPGHVTATGLVLHPDGRGIAMVMHGRLRRWLLPGGHVEAGDADIYASAGREVREETGLVVSGGELAGADVHAIPAKIRDGKVLEPYHLHHDVLVWFRAEGTELVVSEESSAVEWVWPEQFEQYRVPPNVLRAYERVLAR